MPIAAMPASPADSVRTQNASAFSASANPPGCGADHSAPRNPAAVSVIERSVR